MKMQKLYLQEIYGGKEVKFNLEKIVRTFVKLHQTYGSPACIRANLRGWGWAIYKPISNELKEVIGCVGKW